MSKQSEQSLAPRFWNQGRRPPSFASFPSVISAQGKAAVECRSFPAVCLGTGLPNAIDTKTPLLHPGFPANVSAMGTVAEIEAAIRQLPAAEARAVAQWLQQWHV